MLSLQHPPPSPHTHRSPAFPLSYRDSARHWNARAANAEELAALKAALEDAEQNHGETEVLDALFGIASFHARVGDKDEAYTAFDIIVAKPKVSTGKKIDASMAKLRVALFFMVRARLWDDALGLRRRRCRRRCRRRRSSRVAH